ncbi:hypothetical protein D3C81_1602740 [compost metagenome]
MMRSITEALVTERSLAVVMKPGDTVFTVTPRAPTSRASARVKPRIADLAVE